MRRGFLSKMILALLGFMIIQLPVAGVNLASASETDVDLNSVVVVAGDGPNAGKQISDGKGSTSFSFLPQGKSECQGDSAEGNYRIQSFIVPQTVDPKSLTFESTKPAGVGNWALYDVNTRPYVQDLTSVAVAPGKPGRIDSIPQLSFAVFPPGTLAPGLYKMGIACSLMNDATRIWETTIEITEDLNDSPANIRWTVIGGVTAEGGSTNPVPLLALGVVSVALAFFLSYKFLEKKRVKSGINK
jgi:hypothetical protein